MNSNALTTRYVGPKLIFTASDFEKKKKGCLLESFLFYFIQYK